MQERTVIARCISGLVVARLICDSVEMSHSPIGVVRLFRIDGRRGEGGCCGSEDRDDPTKAMAKTAEGESEPGGTEERFR